MDITPRESVNSDQYSFTALGFTTGMCAPETLRYRGSTMTEKGSLVTALDTRINKLKRLGALGKQTTGDL